VAGRFRPIDESLIVKRVNCSAGEEVVLVMSAVKTSWFERENKHHKELLIVQHYGFMIEVTIWR